MGQLFICVVVCGQKLSPKTIINKKSKIGSVLGIVWSFKYSTAYLEGNLEIFSFIEEAVLSLFKIENFNQVRKRKIEDSSGDDKESKKMDQDDSILKISELYLVWM